MSSSTAANNSHHPSPKRWLRFLFQCSLAVLIVAVYVFNERVRGSSAISMTDISSINQSPKNILSQNADAVAHSRQQWQDPAESPEPPAGLSPHAKEVLLEAARDRVQTLDRSASTIHGNTLLASTSKNSNSTVKNHQALPPLDSLVRKITGKSQPQQQGKDPQIVADVQFLLDFAVVGFGKCGTTTLLQWLQQTNANSTTNVKVRAPNYEAQFLNNQRPAQLVRKMYNFAVEEQEARQRDSQARIIKGFKNPSDIRRPHSRALLTNYWPQTPLIVTVRHPVDWLVSIYNYFKIEKGAHNAHLPASHILDRGGRDHEGNTQRFVSTAKGEFHAILAELGKTELAAGSDEWKLLQPWLDPQGRASIKEHPLPNPIFFMEMQQLSDSNTTRAQLFAHDLEAFLGLPRNHLPFRALHVRPNANRVKKPLDHLKLDICEPEYQPVLDEMMAISRAASQWFRQYFMVSPDVTVSSPEYLKEIFEGWMVNPCDAVESDDNEGKNQNLTVKGS